LDQSHTSCPALGCLCLQFLHQITFGASLPLTFVLCSLELFDIVLPEWLFGFGKKRLCYTLLRVAQRLHDFLSPPSRPGHFLSFFPSQTLKSPVWGSRGYLDLEYPSFFHLQQEPLSLPFFSIPRILHPLPTISNLIPR
jgi:hypothetical protein